ncbi:MAG: class I SAM-dependent methyltransferase [Bacteroidia bacterium]
MTKIHPDSSELAKQLRLPHGEFAQQVGEFMERNNREMYSLCIRHASIMDDDCILEIGPGNGGLVSMFYAANNSIRYTGIEMSPEMIHSCQLKNEREIEKGRARFIHGSILGLEEDDSLFDQIFGINVIYFLEPLEEYLTKLNSLLKSGGKLVLGYRQKESMLKLPFIDSGFTLFSDSEIEHFLIKSGFSGIHFFHAEEEIRLLQGGTAVLSYTTCLASKAKMT